MKFLEHINKYRKWYLLGIGVAWLLVALFVPVYKNDLYLYHPNFTFIYLLNFNNSRVMFTASIIILFVVPIAIFLSSFFKNEKYFFYSSNIAMILIIFSIIAMFVGIKNTGINYDYPTLIHVSVFPYISLVFALLYISISLIIPIVIFKKTTPKKLTKTEILTKQVEDLQRQIDELKQNQRTED